jgi:hypothetical protein
MKLISLLHVRTPHVRRTELRERQPPVRAACQDFKFLSGGLDYF